MNFLGIHYGHNATVCLMQNGKITFCQSEERLNRLKNSTGFPMQTLDYMYRNVISPDEIDYAVLYQKWIYGYLYLKSQNFKPTQYGYYLDPAYSDTGLRKALLKTDFGWNLRKRKMSMVDGNPKLRAEAHAYFSESLRLPKERVLYLDHHLAHAYSAVPNVQGWGKALIFTLDGVGDNKCGTVNILQNGKLSVISENDHRNSLGYYYAATTSIMGMKAGEHEFKVMGLAPYAKSQYYKPIADKLCSLLRVDAHGEWKSVPNPEKLLSTLERVYRFQRFDNIAGAVQELAERRILEWVRYWVTKTGIHDIAVAGGVFMNVKASQRVLELPEVNRMFVVPSAADESCPIGCVTWASTEFEPERKVEPLSDLYLGVRYDDPEIESAIERTGASGRYEVRRPENINAEVAHLLSRNQIVARCSGRMEWGARALGNRSILANPSEFRNVQKINDAIKSRDFWMPFTPSVLAEEMPRYVIDSSKIEAPYMCITFNSTQEARQQLPAAIHPKDFTVRPQAVSKEWNADYHDIISRFREETGIGAVLNTSFNLHGEPNVCSPEDAIHTMDNSGLDHLTMGSYLLSRRADNA